MALYYLKESESPASLSSPAVEPVVRRPIHPLISILLSLIILITSLLQFLPLTWTLEESLLQRIPKRYLPISPAPPSLVLLELPATNEGIASLDVAMALRGLGKLHPGRILLAGKVIGDEQSGQLLDGVFKTINAEGIEVIQGHEDSDQAGTAEFHSVPLCRYDPPLSILPHQKLRVVTGKLSNREHGCFLPVSNVPSTGLELFAETPRGEAVGSLWWEVLRDIMGTPEVGSSPVWLLGGKLLYFPNRPPMLLGKEGYLPISNGVAMTPKSMTLEDFLLGIEQKERGETSSEFESVWGDSLVFIGKESDRQSLGTLAQISSRLLWRKLSIIWQLIIALGCITALWIGAIGGRFYSISLAAILPVATMIAYGLSVHEGLLIPWIPPLATSLFLLLIGLTLQGNNRRNNIPST